MFFNYFELNMKLCFDLMNLNQTLLENSVSLFIGFTKHLEIFSKISIYTDDIDSLYLAEKYKLSTIYIYIYVYIYFFGCTGSQLWQAASLVAAHWLVSCSTWTPQLRHGNSQLQHAHGIQFPDQGSNPGPLHWEHGVLSTAPPGKSLSTILFHQSPQNKKV